jgi:hypothetical protein
MVMKIDNWSQARKPGFFVVFRAAAVTAAWFTCFAPAIIGALIVLFYGAGA